MTGQLALPFADPIPVVEDHHPEGRTQRARLMWRRGRVRGVVTITLAGGVL